MEALIPFVLTLDGSVTTFTTHSSALTPQAHLPSHPHHLPAAPDLQFPLPYSSKVTPWVLVPAPSRLSTRLGVTHSASEAPGHFPGWEASLGSAPSPLPSPNTKAHPLLLGHLPPHLCE